ncbi:MAG: T9SS C-terminal target domain-containing protein [Bacteroidetes bacterium]|nr:MAG: T9SS C-terminal target domain-containing protein [Bacteroidota bacterium]
MLVLLPVDLAKFNLHKLDGLTLLTFSTTSELHNSHFDIERSADGRSFQAIGQVSGKGTTTVQVDYEFVDEKPLPGWNYYRLKQVDYDGAFEYYGPVSVWFGEGTGKHPIRIYPSAVSDQFTLELDEDWSEGLDCAILNVNGQVLRQWQLQDKALRITVDVTQLPAGTYWLRWQQGARRGTARFLKL